MNAKTKNLGKALAIGLGLYALSVAALFWAFVLIVSPDVVDKILKNHAPVFLAILLAAGYWVSMAALEAYGNRLDRRGR